MLQWMDVSTLGGRKLMELNMVRGGFPADSDERSHQRNLQEDVCCGTATTILQQHAEHSYILRLYHLHNIAYITGCVLSIFIVLVLFVLMFGFLYVCLYCIFVCFFICYTTLHSETDGKEDVHGCLSQPAECRCRCTGQGNGSSFYLKIRRFLFSSVGIGAWHLGSKGTPECGY